jgi:predicted DNA-binding transcriptional regulator AlpA
VSETLLTARETAAKLSVSTGALLRWTRAGLVPGAVKLPSGAVRYRPELLDAWLDERAIKPDGADEKCDQPDAPTGPRKHTTTTIRDVTNPDPELGIANEEEDDDDPD